MSLVEPMNLMTQDKLASACLIAYDAEVRADEKLGSTVAGVRLVRLMHLEVFVGAAVGGDFWRRVGPFGRRCRGEVGG